MAPLKNPCLVLKARQGFLCFIMLLGGRLTACRSMLGED